MCKQISLGTSWICHEVYKAKADGVGGTLTGPTAKQKELELSAHYKDFPHMRTVFTAQNRVYIGIFSEHIWFSMLWFLDRDFHVNSHDFHVNSHIGE